MFIQYVKYGSVDKKKWDECIMQSSNGLIYAYSFYLDAMAKNWDALILNDYEAVMPLTWKKKLGIRYLYQPPFTQQTGIFYKHPVNTELAEDFINAAKQYFSFAEIFMNARDPIQTAKACTNLILPLNHQYLDIQANYKSDLLKNLKHAEKFHLSYSSSENYNEAIDAYIKEYADRHPHVTNSDYNSFKSLCDQLLKKKMLMVKRVTSPDNKLLAIALLLKDKKRLYNVMSTVTAEGKKTEANHFLFDEMIKEYAGELDVLDFEGSDIEGIAFFYKKFGAVNEPYYFVRYNNLPAPLKFLKR